MQIVKIAIYPFEAPFSYQVSAELAETLSVGSRLNVNFRGKLKEGIILETNCALDPTANYKLKIIPDETPSHQCLNPEQFKFLSWMTNYYQESLTRILPQIIPSYSAATIKSFVEIIDRKTTIKGKTQIKIVDFLKAQTAAIKKEDLIKLFPTARPALKKLLENKIIKISHEKQKVIFDGGKYAKEYPSKVIELNADQTKAFEAINASLTASTFQAFLLFGVTGSGKTEVYLDLCEEALAQNKGVMLLVPEIALTPQLIDRFASRLKTNFAVLHSDLGSKNRWHAWQSLLEGEIQVVIGVRSAVFAPVPNLGLVIVDEEHDGSYKQSDNFRYHGRDLAVKRAQLCNCPVVLGSATPTLESIYNFKLDKYQVLKLRKKHSSARENQIKIIDLSKLKKKDFASANISKQLAEEIAYNLKNNQQSFILYNRRGFASYLECESCNESLKCPHCDLTLTYYQHKTLLLCHACGYQSPIPDRCLACKKTKSILEHPLSGWRLRGSGTEKIDQELSDLFPNAQIARLDRDLVKSSSEYRTILTKARENKIDILIGTQMIAKGHDLPNVTLVGVIDCDVGLNFPDFRASERVFQLLTQVAGRAGRGDLPGKVFFQTRQPSHPSILYAKNDDYLGFVNNELQIRKTLSYPPFCKILRIVISSEDEASIPKYLQQLQPRLIKLIESHKMQLSLLGPVTAPIAKVRKHYRWHYLCKSSNISQLQLIMRFFQNEKTTNKKIRISLDLDPQDLL